jgi:hypothetical protein
MQEVNDKNGNRIPRYTSQLPQEWISMTNEKSLTISEGSDDFCVFCTYIIKVSNNQEKDTKFRISID